MGALVVSATAW